MKCYDEHISQREDMNTMIKEATGFLSEPHIIKFEFHIPLADTLLWILNRKGYCFNSVEELGLGDFYSLTRQEQKHFIKLLVEGVINALPDDEYERLKNYVVFEQCNTYKTSVTMCFIVKTFMSWDLFYHKENNRLMRKITDTIKRLFMKKVFASLPSNDEELKRFLPDIFGFYYVDDVGTPRERWSAARSGILANPRPGIPGYTKPYDLIQKTDITKKQNVVYSYFVWGFTDQFIKNMINEKYRVYQLFSPTDKGKRKRLLHFVKMTGLNTSIKYTNEGLFIHFSIYDKVTAPNFYGHFGTCILYYIANLLDIGTRPYVKYYWLGKYIQFLGRSEIADGEIFPHCQKLEFIENDFHSKFVEHNNK